ncbi:helix-turn-helix domain-containing protein [Eubacteriales bacterium OttesenSCG-928-A19]|nr:helix-turn-helix domain-containing protein [Eubacteriales bacterium OttesenSCG-928-A19]
MQKISRLYLRIISSFVVIVFFAAGVLFFSYRWFSTQNERLFLERIEENIVTVNRRVAEAVGNINSIGSSILSNPIVQENLRPYSSLSDKNRYQYSAIRSLLHQSSLQLGNIVDGMFLYVDEERVIYQQGTAPSESFFNSVMHYTRYDRDFWLSLLTRANDVSFLQTDWYATGKVDDYRPVVPVVFRRMLMGNPVVIVTNISCASVLQMYREAAVFSDSVYLLYDRDMRELIDGSGLFDGWSEPLETLADGERIRLDGEAYYASVVPLDLFGWEILCLTPTSAISGINAYYRLTTLVLLSVYVAIGLLVSWRSSRSIYAPIRSMRHDIVLRQQAENQAWQQNELEYIRSSIHAMADAHDDSLLRRREYAYQYVCQGLVSIMEGRRPIDEDSLLHMISQELDFNNPCFQCVDILLDIHQTESPYQAREELLASISAYIAQAFSSVCNTLLIKYRENMLVIVLNLQEDSQEKVLACCEEIRRNTLVDASVCTLRQGVGGAVGSIAGIAQSFEQANTAILSIPPVGGSVIACYRQGMEGSYPFNNRPIFEAIASRDLPRLEEAITVALSGFKQACVRYSVAGDAVQAILSLGKRLEGLTEDGKASFDRRKQAPLDTLAVLILRPDINTVPLMDYFRKLFAELALRSEGRSSGDMAARVRQYIDQHFHEEISLDIIADKFGVSGKYISRVFKQDVEVNFTEYLARIRVEKTKELLKTDLSLGIIAGMVGINNRTTFMRTFRKVEGMTPNEYRDMIRRVRSSDR